MLLTTEPPIRVLLIDDDEEIATRLANGLKAAGFVVEHAAHGDDGYELGRDQTFDAVILDLGLPGRPGLNILQMWRAEKIKVPVLILSARGGWTEKVKGLNAGADDYLAKPFHLPEIVARLNALTRRTSGAAHPLLTHKDVTLDTVSGRASVNGRPIDLTAHELRMLTYFFFRVGRIVTQRELSEHLYKLEEGVESNTIEVYVARLRKKLGRDLITTIRGLGYRMD